MSAPSRSEIADFLTKLRMQASLFQDPAIIDAVEFIERLVGGDDAEAASDEFDPGALANDQRREKVA